MTSPSLHALLLLSDSALPLGSFAFSSGLESYLAHSKASYQSSNATNGHQPKLQWKPSITDLKQFLKQSILNAATTTLPFVAAAHKTPSHLLELDDILDASTACTVARRASTTQGRALLSIWERSLRDSATSPSDAGNAIASLSGALNARVQVTPALDLRPQAHLAPLFGATARALGLEIAETEYVYLLNHAKAVLSAAVRAGVIGPYVSQSILASGELQGWICDAIAAVARETAHPVDGIEERDVDVRGAGVSVPTMDLWMGRHELLYSRIFNS